MTFKRTTLDTQDVVYGTVVNIVCDRGFILSDGNLSKSVQCIDANYSLVWNDTVDNCQRNYLYLYFLMQLNVSKSRNYLRPCQTYLVIRFGKFEAGVTSSNHFVQNRRSSFFLYLDFDIIILSFSCICFVLHQYTPFNVSINVY